MTFEQAPQRIVIHRAEPDGDPLRARPGRTHRRRVRYDNYPEEALEKPKVGNLQGNAEALSGRRTGLRVRRINGERLHRWKASADLGVNVFTTEPTTIDEVIDSILQIGVITDAQEQAKKSRRRCARTKQNVIDTVAGIRSGEEEGIYRICSVMDGGQRLLHG